MPVGRGEVYWVEFDPVRGSGQGGPRPALVVQNDVGNRHSPTTVDVAITRTIPLRLYPFVVIVEPVESGPTERGAVNCSHMATIQKSGSASRLRALPGESEMQPIGQLGPEKMAEVDRALKFGLLLE